MLFWLSTEDLFEMDDRKFYSVTTVTSRKEGWNGGLMSFWKEWYILKLSIKGNILDGMEDTVLGLTSFFPPCFVLCTFW